MSTAKDIQDYLKLHKDSGLVDRIDRALAALAKGGEELVVDAYDKGVIDGITIAKVAKTLSRHETIEIRKTFAWYSPPILRKD